MVIPSERVQIWVCLFLYGWSYPDVRLQICVFDVSFRPTQTGLCKFGWVWSSLIAIGASASVDLASASVGLTDSNVSLASVSVDFAHLLGWQVEAHQCIPCGMTAGRGLLSSNMRQPPLHHALQHEHPSSYNRNRSRQRTVFFLGVVLSHHLKHEMKGPHLVDLS